MITLEGEITEVNTPPNQADRFREVTIWLSETEEHLEINLPLEQMKRDGMVVGDKINVKLEKKFDIDSLAQDLFKQN